MLSVYTNENELINSYNQINASRFEEVDLNILSTTAYSVLPKNKELFLEFHVYTINGSYLTSAYRSKYETVSSETVRLSTSTKFLAVDVFENLTSIGIDRGQFKIVYNFFDNVLGNFDTKKIFIKDISPSRRELRLQFTDNTDTVLLTGLRNLSSYWEESKNDDIFRTFVLNFGLNQTYQIVNMYVPTNSKYPELVIRLNGILPISISEKTECWISEQLIDPVAVSVSMISKYADKTYNTLYPNFDVDTDLDWSVATGYKSWEELLGTNVSTSQQIIDSYFSSGSMGTKLNINYRYFDNFVHYSSAVERVKNFRYKLSMIEYFTSKIQSLLLINGGDIASVNLNDYYAKRNAVVSGFDDFEKYLFFETTGSQLYSHYDTSSSISPWPKDSSYSSLQWGELYRLWSEINVTWPTEISGSDAYSYFLQQADVDSDIGIAYYNDLLEKAEIYDRFNIHKLRNSIPFHIQSSDDNEQYVLFVDMIGQHFDILWTYINHLTTISSREEHPKDGMPTELLPHVAESMGFPLINGKSTSDLWKYALGLDENGQILQSGIDGITTLPDSNNTKETWRRLVNNLPLILKTKGTARSIKALLSCFGVPTTLLSIREFGGPTTSTDKTNYPEYIRDVYHYVWSSVAGNLILSSSMYTNAAGISVYPNSLEFRFKPDNVFNYTVGTPYTIFSGEYSSSLTLIKESTSDNQATLTLSINGKSGSVADLEIFDDNWCTVLIDETLNGSGSLKVVRSVYGYPVYIRSASFATGSGNPLLQQNLKFTSDNTSDVDKFNGYFHEIRLWSGSLNDETLYSHAASANTYTYNVNRSAIFSGEEASKPYDHLLQRFSLSAQVINEDIDGFYQYSNHPNQNINIGKIYFKGYATSGSIDFVGVDEMYYTQAPSLGASTLYSNKVRIESSSLASGKRLNTQTRVERSSYDKYSLDSNRLGIYFSPQNAINEDIYNQVGYFELDDFIGNPIDDDNECYRDLTNFSVNYWKKFNIKNDFEAYFRALKIYDFTLFKYIEKLVPYRANLVTGLVVEPNVLERSRVRTSKRIHVENLVHSANLGTTNPVLHGEYQYLTASISNFTSLNKLNQTWVQNKYVGSFKFTESGSYIPMQPVIMDSSLHTSVFLADNYQVVSSIIEPFTISGTYPAYEYVLPSPGEYLVDIYFDQISTSLPFGQTILIDGNIVANQLYTIYEGNVAPLHFTRNFTFTSASFSIAGEAVYSANISYIVVRKLNLSNINTDFGTGYQNIKFNGSKISGNAVNSNSTQTIDGGPVVKVTKVNPNKIVFANNQVTTINKSVTGKKTKSI